MLTIDSEDHTVLLYFQKQKKNNYRKNSTKPETNKPPSNRFFRLYIRGV
jgi:hypothetical protein